MKYIILLVIMIGYWYMPTHAQNRALNFDGTNDFANIPTNGIFTAYTIEAWVKFNGGTTANQSVIVGTDGVGSFINYSHQIRTDGAGRFVHYTFDNVNIERSVVGTTVAVTERWYHVAITAENGGVSRLFVNGVEEGSPRTINTLWTGINRFHVGAGSGGIAVAPGANFLNGEVDEVRAWNYPRCAADIMATMNCSLAGNEPSLRASYNFNQGVAGSNNAGLTTLTNNATSGTTFDGTLTNFALNTTTSNWVVSNNNVSGVCVPPTASTTGNRVLAFDGVNDFANIPTNGIFTAYTIEAWVKFNGGTTANQSVIVGTDGAGSFAAYSHQIRTDGAGRFVHYTFDNVNGARSVVGTTVAVTGRWYHIAITAENGSVSRLFVNGVEEGTPLAINTLWTGINRFHVGTGSGAIPGAPGAISLNGEVDEVRAWNYVRCAADIMTTMNCELTGNEPSLRAYYNFNQGAAGGANLGITTLTNNAASGATFNGTLNNFTLLSQCTSNWVASTNNVSGVCVPPIAANTGNRALSFDGVNDLVSMPSAINNTEDFTVEIMVKPNRVGVFAGIVAREPTGGATGQVGWGIRQRNNQFGAFVGREGLSNVFLIGGPTIQAGVWYHVAFSRNASRYTLYVNGVEVASQDNGVVLNTTLPILLGRLHSLSEPFAGELDEFRIWNYARCQADIMATMNCELTGNEAGLRAYYNFNQGAAGGTNTTISTLPNLATATGAANNGTLNNFTLLSQCASNWVASTNNVNRACNFRPASAAAINLSNNSIAENNAVNEVIGALSMPTNNPCMQVINYTLIPDQLDNALFNINNNNLRASASFDFEARNTYRILVRATGSFGISDQLFTINITNVIDANEIILSPEIVAKAGNREVTLTWVTVPSADQYEIFMYSDNMPQTFVGNTEANTFNIKGLNNGITYNFRVVALLTQFNIRSGFSNTVSARPSIVLGTDEESLNSAFKVYPNPNSGSFSLVIGELKGKNAQLTVLDLGGRILHQQNVATAGSLETELNLNLASGMYFLQISTEKENLRRKLVIER